MNVATGRKRITNNEPGIAPREYDMFEVEIKFAVSDREPFLAQLDRFQIELDEPVEEIDRFYRHPVRNFVETDECLRIRRRIPAAGVEECFLTYKGPKIDESTKTRRELEIPLTEPSHWDELFRILGFMPGGEVRKFRRRAEWQFASRKFDVLLDFLPELEKRNKNAYFVELETLAEESEVDDARDALIEASKMLGLTSSIRTSYLGLLAQNEGVFTQI